MIPSWAKPGSKVVCVDDGPGTGWDDGEQVVKGCVYTVRRAWFDEGMAVLDFFEVQRSRLSKAFFSADVGYGVHRFRPVIEQKDDIALFTHLLNTTSEDQLIKEEAL